VQYLLEVRQGGSIRGTVEYLGCQSLELCPGLRGGILDVLRGRLRAALGEAKGAGDEGQGGGDVTALVPRRPCLDPGGAIRAAPLGHGSLRL
jgi:hypothetical protein